jgi:hypothetical protein
VDAARTRGVDGAIGGQFVPITAKANWLQRYEIRYYPK